MTTSAEAPGSLPGISSPSCAPRGERFPLIDAIRGLAAMGIACYHLDRYGPIPVAVDPALPEPLEWLLKHSWVGVQFFFVIAGFVAAYSLRGARITPSYVVNFALRRLIRLGSPYWVVAILVAGLNVLAIRWLGDDSLAGDVPWSRFFSQLLFLPDIIGYENLSAGMWFVAIDLQFGMLLLILLGIAGWLCRGRPAGSWLDQLALLVLIVPLAMLALFHFNLDSDNEMWAHYFFHLTAFGAVVWWVLEGRLSASVFWAYLSMMLLGLALYWRWEVAIASIAGVTLYAAARSGAMAWSGGRLLQYLGRISYSLFLIHYLAQWIVLTLGYRLTGTQPVAGMLWMVLAMVTSLAAAHALHILVEQPANRLARRLKPH